MDARPEGSSGAAGTAGTAGTTGWFTDHLCWTAAGGSNTHDLLPIPYTEENANYIGDRAAFVQDRIGLPFGLENLSSYLTFQESEMEEWEFLRAVVERADCGILLDVNNIHVSAVNHGFDPRGDISLGHSGEDRHDFIQ